MIRFEDEQEDVVEGKEKPKKSMLDRLLETRTITIFGEINMKLAQEVTEKLMLLAADSDDDIKIFINSPGGHVESGDTIFDMIRFVKPTVKIVGTGWVASAGALIYSAVEQENRFSLPNTRFLLHQPMGGVRGQAQDIKIEAEEIIKMRERLNRIFAEQTGQKLEKVSKDTERNFWMSAQEGIDYGLVGKIVNSIDDIN
ncbi:MAG: ATP-dependent Clp protease proteolytic subunit [Ardenticatenaceae bacterium]|nr:MAG: ATP-dependent Clp protease proteolytic subunit [Ardenticatenaceae bacterium]